MKNIVEDLNSNDNDLWLQEKCKCNMTREKWRKYYFILFLFVFIIGVFLANSKFIFPKRNLDYDFTDYIIEVNDKMISDALNGAEDELQFIEKEEVSKINEELKEKMKDTESELISYLTVFLNEVTDGLLTDHELELVVSEGVKHLKKKEVNQISHLADMIVDDCDTAIEEIVEQNENSSTKKIVKAIDNKESEAEQNIHNAIKDESNQFLININEHAKDVILEVMEELLNVDFSCQENGKKSTKVKNLKIKPKFNFLHPGKKIKFLHPGKSGGGTFDSRLKYFWDMKFDEAHPHPMKIKKDDISFITIRDPIDRFVSSFNWRLVVLCNIDGDKRNHGKKAVQHPESYCKVAPKEEGKILFHKYKKDVNLLAEALCSNNKKERKQAEKDVLQIQHAQHSLSDWLRNVKNWHNIVPIVLEKYFDFNKQIDEAIQYGQDNYNFENELNFESRKRMVCEKDIQEKNEKIKNLVKKLDASKHSSSVTNTPSLSRLGHQCLAQYYAKDYALIEKLKNKSCKSIDCKQALHSILSRRSCLL